jgi:hypothetical protein
MTITLGLLLFISVSINIILVWYTRKLVDKFLYFEDNIREVLGALGEFSTHLNQINKMERYYGDSVLEGLINHMKSLEEPLGSFINGFTWEEENEQTKEEE